MVADIDDRMRFSKHFVILGDVECLGLLDAQIGAGGCYASVTQSLPHGFDVLRGIVNRAGLGF